MPEKSVFESAHLVHIEARQLLSSGFLVLWPVCMQKLQAVTMVLSSPCPSGPWSWS